MQCDARFPALPTQDSAQKLQFPLPERHQHQDGANGGAINPDISRRSITAYSSIPPEAAAFAVFRFFYYKIALTSTDYLLYCNYYDRHSTTDEVE